MMMFHESRAESPDGFSLVGLSTASFGPSLDRMKHGREKEEESYEFLRNSQWQLLFPFTSSSSSCFSSHEVSLPLFFFLP